MYHPMKNMNNQEKNTYVRQHILSALLELMHTQDFVSISIQALVDAAGVGRASFYRNFASKEDVLQQESVRLTNEWKTNFDHEHPDGTPGQDNLWLVSLLDFYKDHAEFYLALYHAGLSNIMLETILGYFDRSPEIPNGLAYLNSAIGYMLYGWVHEWMCRGMQESGTELARMLAEAQKKLNSMVTKMPKGYFVEWSGQYENLIRGEQTLKMIMPLVLIVIFLSMYFAFNSYREAFFNLISIPFALIGGVFMISIWGVNLSVAVAVGFIALFGLAVETGIVMVIYLNDAMVQLIAKNGNSRETITNEELREYVIHGAAKRLRPKIMTVCVTLFGLVPILWSHGVGSDMMKPIVLPMVGGVFTSAIHILLVTPIIFYMQKEWELNKLGKIDVLDAAH